MQNNCPEKNNIVNSDSADVNTPAKTEKRKRKLTSTNIMVILVIVLIGIAIVLPIVSINYGARKTYDEYAANFNDVSSKVSNKVKEAVFDYIEEKEQVSAEGTIYIGEIREISKLDVLEVGYDAYVIEDAKDNAVGLTVWEVIPGMAIYSVNLEIAEFTVDETRNYVLIKVPEPKMEYTISYDNRKLIFSNEGPSFNWTNKSAAAGEIAHRQEERALEEIRNTLANNQEHFEKAKASAKDTLTRLVEVLNPGNDSLVIEIEFMN